MVTATAFQESDIVLQLEIYLKATSTASWPLGCCRVGQIPGPVQWRPGIAVPAVEPDVPSQRRSNEEWIEEVERSRLSTL